MRKAKQQLTLSQREAVAAVSARLDGKKQAPIKVVFEQLEVSRKRRNLEDGTIYTETATVGVWIDMDAIVSLAWRARGNQNRKAKKGPLHVELHTVR